MPTVVVRGWDELRRRYPPSPPCGCGICRDFCKRPGWWTVEEAAKAADSGYADRMMLEISPELDFGVLSPAFKGCGGSLANAVNAPLGCCFYSEDGCELHATPHMPLECRFCHHNRMGKGAECHKAIEADWHTPHGKALVGIWMEITGFWEKQYTSNL